MVVFRRIFLSVAVRVPVGCFTNEVEPDNGYHYEKNSSESDYGAEDTDAHDRLPGQGPDDLREDKKDRQAGLGEFDP